MERHTPLCVLGRPLRASTGLTGRSRSPTAVPDQLDSGPMECGWRCVPAVRRKPPRMFRRLSVRTNLPLRWCCLRYLYANACHRVHSAFP